MALDGRDHTYNRSIGPTVLARIRPSTVSTAQHTPPIQPVSTEPIIIKKEKDADAPPQPAISVETIENLNGANQMPNNRPKAVAKKSVTVRTFTRTPTGVYQLQAPNGATQQHQPQQKQQQPRSISQVIRMPAANSNVSPVTTTTAKKAPAVYPKLPTEKRTQSDAVQQPVKLWNNVMLQTPKEPLRIHVSVKTRETGQGSSNLKLPSKETQKQYPIENDANDGVSSLKIGQVFEGVNEDMVDELQIVPLSPSSSSPSPSPQPVASPTPTTISQPPTPQPAFAIKSIQSASPLLDTLVKEIAHDTNGIQTAYLTDESVKLVTIVRSDDKSCADYRCNICLTFNDSNVQYREHMQRKHGFRVVCEQCHEAFNHQQAFLNHLKVDSDSGVTISGRPLFKSKCSLSANASRTYICIVEPPIILMRNEKVFAFRCKYCDLAFQTQRNYVQHAQRHAKQFRCKRCPTKPLNIDLMREHLTHHKD